MRVALSRVEFVNPIHVEGAGGITGAVLSKDNLAICYDMNTLTIRLVRGRGPVRIPVSNVKSMTFIEDPDAPPVSPPKK